MTTRILTLFDDDDFFPKEEPVKKTEKKAKEQPEAAATEEDNAITESQAPTPVPDTTIPESGAGNTPAAKEQTEGQQPKELADEGLTDNNFIIDAEPLPEVLTGDEPVIEASAQQAINNDSVIAEEETVPDGQDENNNSIEEQLAQAVADEHIIIEGQSLPEEQDEYEFSTEEQVIADDDSIPAQELLAEEPEENIASSEVETIEQSTTDELIREENLLADTVIENNPDTEEPEVGAGDFNDDEQPLSEITAEQNPGTEEYAEADLADDRFIVYEEPLPDEQIESDLPVVDQQEADKNHFTEEQQTDEGFIDAQTDLELTDNRPSYEEPVIDYSIEESHAGITREMPATEKQEEEKAADEELSKQILSELIQLDYTALIHRDYPFDINQAQVVKKDKEIRVPSREPVIEDVEEPVAEEPEEVFEEVVPLPEWNLDKKYYSIGEVAQLFSVNTSHIRFWTNEFKLKPRTTRKGDRLYNPKDIAELRLIHHLVKEKKHTIKGAREKLKAEKDGVNNKLDLKESLVGLRNMLLQIKEQL